MARLRFQTLGSLALCATAASAAAAAEPPIAMQVVQVGEVQYISGGKSPAERAELRARTEDFRLQVRFGSNAVISPKNPVSIKLERHDAHADNARPIQLTAAGPLLLMNMPSGTYTLTASPAGAPAVESEIELQPGDVKHLDIDLASTNTSNAR